MNDRPRPRAELCPACSRPHGRKALWRYCPECQREYDRWRRKSRPRKCCRCPTLLPLGSGAWLCPPCHREYNREHAAPQRCTICGAPANRQHTRCGHCRYLARTGRLERLRESLQAVRDQYEKKG